MNVSHALSKHFNDVNTGGNWTAVNLTEVLTGLTWQQAIQKIGNLNTIYTLVFHLNYYVELQVRVLKGGQISGNDAASFEHPPMTSEKEWKDVLTNVFRNVSALTAAIHAFDNAQLSTDFGNTEKHGSYYRNIQGMIEHHHYHLGQLVMLKKLIG